MEIEHNLGADIIMALDECPPAGAGVAHIKGAVERSLRWGSGALKRTRVYLFTSVLRRFSVSSRGDC